MIQAVATSILLLVTWLSISRADKQIDLTNNLLQLEYSHYLHVDYDISQSDLILTNVSRLPIAVSKVVFEILLVRPIQYDASDAFVLQSGEQKLVDMQSFAVNHRDISNMIDREFGPSASYEPTTDQDKLREFLKEDRERRYFRVSYRYAGTGNKQYVKLYKLVIEASPYRSEAPINWRSYLQEMIDYDNASESLAT